MRKAMVFLQSYNISPVYALKIYKKYRSKTFEVVSSNPYKLCDDIYGIGFKRADRLAFDMGINPDSPNRIKAGIKYVLNEAAAEGHVYLVKDALIKKAFEILNIDVSIIDNIISELLIENQLYQEISSGETRIYLNYYFYAEISAAKKLLELSMKSSETDSKEANSIIKNFENKKGITFAKKQKEAIKKALGSGVLVITGGPGTGKTTILNAIINILEEKGFKIALAAPTGRAAKRMSEATGKDAQTIHRLLGISFLTEDSRIQKFDKTEDDPIDADAVIIDEASMLDIILFNSLLKAVREGSKLILVGDSNQLPSIGAGNVLKDIIKSGKIEVIYLNEVFRQSRESAIIMNAHRINNGEEPKINEKEKDFFFMKRTYPEDIMSAVTSLVTTRLPSFTGYDSVKGIQVLSPMRKGIVGTENINKLLQQVLNPPSKHKKEKIFRNTIFREGDKVMQIKNNYNLTWRTISPKGQTIDEGIGVFNGDSGIITEIDFGNEALVVMFEDNKEVIYDYTQLDELELSYAVTVHKAQGSEYPVVIIPIVYGPPMLMTRNLIYTAITRAKSFVVLVGIYDALKKMIDNDFEVKRNTSLNDRIIGLYDFMNSEKYDENI